MRAGLRDDRTSERVSSYSVPVALDDDCGASLCGCPGPGEDTTGMLPLLKLKQRYRDGYDDDGNAVFAWEDLIEQPAFVAEQRREFDAEAGATRVTGTVTMTNPGTLTEVPETCMIVQLVDAADPTAGVLAWRITGSTITGDLLRFEVERTDGGR